jgi:hypothetical protein
MLNQWERAIIGISEKTAENKTEMREKLAYRRIDRKKAGGGTRTREQVMHDVMYLTKTLHNLHVEGLNTKKTKTAGPICNFMSQKK